MKKLFIIFVLGAIFLIASCGGSSKKENSNETPDSGETVTDEDGDTADEEPADDSEPADTEPADTEPAEDSDKDGGDSQPDEDSTPEPTEADQCVAAGGTWNWDGTESSCTKKVSCKKISVGHAEWNGHDSYTQKYTDGKWSSEVPTKYDETKGDCHFKCNANYVWNGKDCLSECNVFTTDFPCYDPESKLTWSEKYPDMEWSQAFKYCRELNGSNYGGNSIGWYLPTIDELKTLLVWSKADSCKVSEENDCLAYYDCYTDASCAEGYDESDDSWIPDPKFSKFGDGDYYEALWSASLVSDYSEYRWILYSYYGAVDAYPSYEEIAFRCVWIEPDEAATECAGVNGEWDRIHKKCTVSCGAKPEHSVWNGDNHYIREYSEGGQTSEITPEYNDETEGTCHFKCAENYSWESGKCVLAANENIDPVPEDQNNTAGVACDPATFVESCDENGDMIWCDSGTVTAFSCTSIGKTCITTVGLYGENKSKNSAYCASPCETPGRTPKSCENNPVGSGGISTADLCLKTSKGYLAFEGVVSQCDTPCNEEGTDCIPLNKVPDDQNSVPGAICDFDTFVEFCDGSVAKWCSSGIVATQDCGDSCLELVGVYGGGYKGKNYAYCFNSCGTAGEITGTPECEYEDEDSVFGSMLGDICLATSKGNRFFEWITYEHCTTPCNTDYTQCLPECAKGSETPCYDPESKLTWSDKSPATLSWTSAPDYCKGKNTSEYGGYDDWRLPTIDELRTLIQVCEGSRAGGDCAVSDPDHLAESDVSEQCYCAADATGGYSKFGETDWYWSSSAVDSDPDSAKAWNICFNNANVRPDEISYTDSVRCVR